MNTGRQPDTVKSYLDALTGALKVLRCPAGLISDAVSDAEEHLNNEIASHPEQSEAEILASVVATYGTPEEIAEEYKSMEATLSGPFPKSDEPESRRIGFFGIIGDVRAWGSLLYILLSVVTGFIYFLLIVVGVSLSLGLSVILIGIPLGLAVMGMSRLLGHVEGRLVEGLLGVRMPRRLPPVTAADETVMARVKAALIDMRTWSTMFYQLILFPLAMVYSAIVWTTFLFASFTLMGISIYGFVSRDPQIRVDDVPWLEHLLNTAPGLALCGLIGLFLFFVTLWVAKGIGWLHGRIAEVLLVRL